MNPPLRTWARLLYNAAERWMYKCVYFRVRFFMRVACVCVQFSTFGVALIACECFFEKLLFKPRNIEL